MVERGCGLVVVVNGLSYESIRDFCDCGTWVRNMACESSEDRCGSKYPLNSSQSSCPCDPQSNPQQVYLS